MDSHKCRLYSFTMNRLTLFVSLLFASACLAAKLPGNFKRCKKEQADFKECLNEATLIALKQLDKEFKEVGLPSAEPLEIPSMTIEAGTGAVGLQQNYKNVKIYGLNKPDTAKFDLDFDKKQGRLEGFFPEIKLVVDYSFNGKILLLPVVGDGPATITLEKVLAYQNYTFEEFDKKGKKHWKATETHFGLQPELIKFHFDNLFNGDKSLGDNINKVLNENWKEVFEDVKGGYEEAFNLIGKNLVNGFMSKVPVEDMF